jgi:hypothetical protein
VIAIAAGRASLVDLRLAPDPPTIDHPAGLWVHGERSVDGTRMIALDVAFDHHERLSGTAREKSRRTICDFFSKKPKAILRH